MCGEGMDSSDKATNKANSAAYKYAMFELFCIPTGQSSASKETPKSGAITFKASLLLWISAKR